MALLAEKTGNIRFIGLKCAFKFAWSLFMLAE